MLHLFKKSLWHMTKDELNQIRVDKPIPEKERVLAYLKGFEKCAYTSQPVIDLFTGEKQNFIADARTDGVYTWYDHEIYHFEKYNLKLNDDFIQRVLSRT